MRKVKYSIIALVITILLSGCTINPFGNQNNSALNTEQKQSNQIAQTVDNSGGTAGTIAPTVRTPTSTTESSTTPSKPAQTSVKRIVPKPPANGKTTDKVNINSTVKQVVVNNPAPTNTQTTTATTTITSGRTQTTDTSSSNTSASTNTTTATSSGAGSLNVAGVPSYDYTTNSYDDYYNDLYAALNDFDSSVCIRVNNYSSSVYNLDVVNTVLYDHFDMDYGLKSVGAEIYQVGDIYVLDISFQYNFSRSTMLAMRSAVESKATSIIASVIKPGMSDIQKELAIHDYVVNNTAYDYDDYVKGTLPPAVYTDYGVLINGSAVCEGYAKAMFRLLNMVGIQNIVVVGTADGVPHTWNLVKINGVYTHVDATWDDPITPDRSQILLHDYFNISDAQMISKDHLWDTSKYPKGVAVPLQ